MLQLQLDLDHYCYILLGIDILCTIPQIVFKC